MPACSVTGRGTLRELPSLAAWLVVTFLAAAAGAVASTRGADFYAQLDRPGWAPPGWLFGPVWTTLYVLMAVAAWLVWQERHGRNVTPALALFLVQLGLNALWTWLFFVWRLGAAAFAEAVLLLALVLATAVAFWRIRPLAAALLTPYAAWVGFAIVLTFTVWQRNADVLA